MPRAFSRTPAQVARWATLILLLASSACSSGSDPQPSGSQDTETTPASDDAPSVASPSDKPGSDSIDVGPAASGTKPKLDASQLPSKPAELSDAGQGSAADPQAAAGPQGAADAQVGGNVTPGADGFPKDEPVNTEQMGPHAFAKYDNTMDTGLNNPTYASSVVYYPTDATPPFAATVFSPGFTATKEDYEKFLGPMLASHGIVILLTSSTTTSDPPQARSDDLIAAIAQLGKENTREGGPLKGKLALDRVCVTGHSMGGGGTLWAASSLGDKIKCALPMQPWQPGNSFSKVTAPTMFIAAQNDNVAAVASNAALFYKSIPDTVPKYYVEFAGASHFLTSNDLGTAYDGQSRYMIAFYKTFAEGDMRYLDILNAPMFTELSKYEHKP